MFRASGTWLSLGTNLQAWIGRELALQAGLRGGIAYAAASSAVRDVDASEYHYGSAPRASATLRLVASDRAALDVSARYLALGRIAERHAGRDAISRVESAFTWRIAGRHALGVDYAWSHRSATFASGAQRRQTLGQFGIFYTLLGDDGLAAVDWRDGS